MENMTALKRFLSRRLPCHADVEDLLHDTYLKAISAERKASINKPTHFLYKVAKNAAINYKARAHHRLSESIENFDELNVLINERTHEFTADQDRQLSLFCEAVGRLPEKCREAFVLKKVYGLSHQEISQRMGIGISTVDKHVARGLRECRTRLRSAGYGLSPEG